MLGWNVGAMVMMGEGWGRRRRDGLGSRLHLQLRVIGYGGVQDGVGMGRMAWHALG